jgi:hypothetical protein
LISPTTRGKKSVIEGNKTVINRPKKNMIKKRPQARAADVMSTLAIEQARNIPTPPDEWEEESDPNGGDNDIDIIDRIAGQLLNNRKHGGKQNYDVRQALQYGSNDHEDHYTRNHEHKKARLIEKPFF